VCIWYIDHNSPPSQCCALFCEEPSKYVEGLNDPPIFSDEADGTSTFSYGKCYTILRLCKAKISGKNVLSWNIANSSLSKPSKQTSKEGILYNFFQGPVSILSKILLSISHPVYNVFVISFAHNCHTCFVKGHFINRWGTNSSSSLNKEHHLGPSFCFFSLIPCYNPTFYYQHKNMRTFNGPLFYIPLSTTIVDDLFEGRCLGDNIQFWSVY